MVFGFSLYLHLSSAAVKGSHTNPPQPWLWFIPRTESRTHSGESRPGLHISETKHECTCFYIFPFKQILSLLLSQCQLVKINDKTQETPNKVTHFTCHVFTFMHKKKKKKKKCIPWRQSQQAPIARLHIFSKQSVGIRWPAAKHPRSYLPSFFCPVGHFAEFPPL